MKHGKWFCLAVASVVLFGATGTLAEGIDPVINEMAMFGISRTNGQLKRYNFDDDSLTDIGIIRNVAGASMLGIDASAYVPGNLNICAFWNDPADNMSRIVYVNTETAAGTVVGQNLGNGLVTGAVAALSGKEVPVTGLININPNNSGTNEFMLYRADGSIIVRDDLHQDAPVGGNGTLYEGDATFIRVKPKGNGSQNGLTVDGQSITMQNSEAYVFIGNMSVKLYNDQVNGNGKAMGKWWIQIVSGDASVHTEDSIVSVKTAWSVFAVQKVESQEDDDVDFEITNKTVVPQEPFAAKVTVLGAAISAGGYYDVPVTVKFEIGGNVYTPFGDFGKALAGNVNDDNNPRNYIFPNTFPGGTSIDVVGQSWLKKKSWYSGKKESHWKIYRTIDGSAGSSFVIVLCDGDDVPSIPGFMNQNSLEEFVEDFIDPATNKIVLDENQAIFLFELGTSNLNSSAADFQDLVVLLTLAKNQADLEDGDDDDSVVNNSSRLLKINHSTGGYVQVMTLDRVYDGLATVDGKNFYASVGTELWKLNTIAQTETLVGSMPADKMFGLEMAGSTLMGFEMDGDSLIPINLQTGAAVGSAASLGMTDLGTITFMKHDEEPLAVASFD